MTEASSAVTNPMERELVLTRVFDAPRSLVFKAWTVSEHLAQWWGPRGFTNPVCEVDPRPGGKIRIVMRAHYGVDHPMIGVFQEVVEPERIVFTNIAVDGDGNTVLEGLTTVTFDEHDGKTTLTLKTRAVAVVAHAAEFLKGMDAGWTQSIDKLEEYLAAA
jgi:uncharacterized protein YndB with AHSA1/START domain